ncbi:type III secretion system inner rod subunit SctI [Burkholderia ubonensis]|uniref:type III secretion system inner rod subunit SctI n=1 Tax=Burkholderia ubonensis TaxID=101571 RepID=UPI0007C72B43|nr:type III secretion system inner rod subunit SctI [Burkholderia ubonensis]
MTISAVHGAPAVFDLTSIETAHPPASLDDMVQQAFTQVNDSANAHMASIDHASTRDLTDPNNLAALQETLSDYNIEISMASSLSRKAISAVETLVKAQ